MNNTRIFSKDFPGESILLEGPCEGAGRFLTSVKLLRSLASLATTTARRLDVDDRAVVVRSSDSWIVDWLYVRRTNHTQLDIR